MNKLALCIIVEGDKKLDRLKVAVESAVDYVNEVCITTNGKEIEETKKWCQEKGYKHSHLDWADNFAEQRNFNFNQTSDSVDYIIWLDSDDELVGGEYIPNILKLARKKEFDTIFLTYWYGNKFATKEQRYSDLVEVELFHNRERIIKKNKYKWVGRVHETPVVPEGSEPKYTGINHTPDKPHKVFPIAVLHRDATRHSSAEENYNRNLRNLRLLELQLEDEKAAGKIDPRTVLYLMRMYRQSDDRNTLIKCISYGEEYLKNSGWDEERATAYIIISECFYNLGEFQRAKETLLGALGEWPRNKEIFLSLANVSYALGLNHDMKFYMEVAEGIELDDTTAGNRNVLDLRFKTELLNLTYHLNVSKKIDKALEAAEKLYEMEPNENNEEQRDYISDLNDYNDACRNIDEFTRYLARAKMYPELQDILSVFPEKFKELPFYNRLMNSYAEPKIWGDKEVCIFANFGGDHFEKWDPTSLKSGIGGSETAVIRLAQEWTKLGYSVVVYGDPKEEGVFDGVEYKSYRRFNPKDRFNIFIQWRGGFMAKKVSSKKFYVDLHDVFNPVDFVDIIDSIDKIFIKSEYHRSLAPEIPDEKFAIISNGI